MGAHLAALLNSEYASGLATAALLTQDVTDTPLIPVDGEIEVSRVQLSDYQTQNLLASDTQAAVWTKRLNAVLNTNFL
jgi:O-succinylbenzoate synthase